MSAAAPPSAGDAGVVGADTGVEGRGVRRMGEAPSSRRDVDGVMGAGVAGTTDPAGLAGVGGTPARGPRRGGSGGRPGLGVEGTGVGASGVGGCGVLPLFALGSGWSAMVARGFKDYSVTITVKKVKRSDRKNDGRTSKPTGWSAWQKLFEVKAEGCGGNVSEYELRCLLKF